MPHFDLSSKEPPPHTTTAPPGHYFMFWGHPIGWPAIPNGQTGSLRGTGTQGLNATTDLPAIEAWFAKKANKSPNTQQSYRKEVTRLLLWAAERNQALSDLRADDYVAYLQFLSDPNPVNAGSAAAGASEFTTRVGNPSPNHSQQPARTKP